MKLPHPCLALCLALPSCVAPIVLEAGVDELRLDGFPDGTTAAEATTADGFALRGVFVPAGEGAPVVLHLLPAGTSITSGVNGIAGMMRTMGVLRGHGFASLALDYRGVGASDGERDPERLVDDGAAMWSEARRRAGGDPGAVVVRAVSLGSIPGAALVERGEAPGALLLFAPIRTATIAGNAPRERYGAVLGTFLSLFLRSPGKVSLIDALRNPRVSTLLFVAEDDAYLPDDEREEVLEAARDGGHETVVFQGDHQELALRAYCFELGSYRGGVVDELLPEERAFLGSYLARRR